MSGVSSAMAPTTVSSTTVVEQAPRTASRVIDGRAIVIVIDRRRLHTLNRTGTFVWSRADRRSVGSIADELAAEFGVSASDASRDVTQFVEQMLAAGALAVVAR